MVVVVGPGAAENGGCRAAQRGPPSWHLVAMLMKDQGAASPFLSSLLLFPGGGMASQRVTLVTFSTRTLCVV